VQIFQLINYLVFFCPKEDSENFAIIVD